ncbi:hypothetical protein ACJIZ3_008510 [Penstemon smallii]|uniref:Uncharacterized protein n=1 Tax=Penstemon smallii TaxID=265156 RepID=A0ABD3TA09_9LAMI
MDGSGKSLLTIRRKKLSLGDSWLVYDGETAENPRILVKKNVNLLKTKCLAHVSSTGGCQKPVYEIEGCYSRRICAVYDDKRWRVMEIKPKESSVRGVAFGMDIFRLVVQPGFDIPLAGRTQAAGGLGFGFWGGGGLVGEEGFLFFIIYIYIYIYIYINL